MSSPPDYLLPSSLQSRRSTRHHHQPMTIPIPTPKKRSRLAAPLGDQQNEPSSGSSDDQDHEDPPPGAFKRKRTRTLTTPQQSSALHALLSQTRFPTTAQREEVGAAIGLSARKVQIWFQNQRQKLRKTQEQVDPTTTSTTTTTTSATTTTTATATATATATTTDTVVLSVPPPLSFHIETRTDPPMSPPSNRRQPLQEPPILLPPLVFEGIKTGPSTPTSLTFSPPKSKRGGSSQRSSLPSSSSQPPRTTPHIPDPITSTAISPPFAIQPEPQWDPRTRDPINFPQVQVRTTSPTSPSHRHHHHLERASDANSIRRTHHHHQPPGSTSRSVRRYDPVRGCYTTPSPPLDNQSIGQASSGGGGDSGLRSPRRFKDKR